MQQNPMKNLFNNIDQNERCIGKAMYLKTTEIYADDLIRELQSAS